ncbi:MAG TPA: hypothetical protein VGS09_08460 [Actinomycetota bacterium]|nr:hypothetical protein [Actinomycetota bacterium]
MRHTIRWSLLPVVLALVVGTGLPALGKHATRPHTDNLKATGHSPHEAQFFGVPSAQRHINSDIAFWGNLAINGNYDGFRIIDISNPTDPQQIVWQHCNGDQGDIVVWDNILVRSWNSPAPPGRSCDGEPVPAGFEGLHVFDISNPSDPDLVTSVETECGSHTATLVPDTANGRALVYNNGSSGACPWFEIVEVPLTAPADAAILRTERLRHGAHRCHDIGVILGDENLAACASDADANVFSIGAPRGGSLEDPEFLYSIAEKGVGIGGNWHSAAFTWDGEVIVLGWEPGGGSAPECEATDPAVKKSAFFYDADTGAKLGQWTLPRPQSAEENCTIHNYNVVPTTDGRYILVSGNYQAGTWVSEFSDPANAVTLAWSDPPPIVPTNLGGAWSSYWYNGRIFESEIQTGLNVFTYTDPVAGASLPHLNPQTQETTIG